MAKKAVRSVATAVGVVLFPLLWSVTMLRDLGARFWFSRRFARCGPQLTFSPLTSAFHYDKIEIGDRVYIGRGANFSGKVTVGDDVMFASGVHITDGYHRWDVVGKTIRDSGPGEKVRVHVESDAWLGANVTLMKGVTFGEGSIAGTKALVLADVPPYSIVVGTPARVASVRFSDVELREHLLLRGRTEAEADAMVERRRSELSASGYDGTGL